MTVLPSRQFNQDTIKAKRAAEDGPVFITHRSRRSHVLLTVEDYERLSKKKESIVDQLALPGSENVDFEPARLGGPLFRAADLS